MSLQLIQSLELTFPGSSPWIAPEEVGIGSNVIDLTWRMPALPGERITVETNDPAFSDIRSPERVHVAVHVQCRLDCVAHPLNALALGGRYGQ